MNAQVLATILTGSFALAGALGGAYLTSRINIAANAAKQAAEDERRWLTDRRQIYARYLSLCEIMLREIDGVGVFLSYDGKEEISDHDAEILSDGLHKYFVKWDEELQPALFEVQLMASPRIADLADRMSGALMAITSHVEIKQTFVEYYPTWFQARDMLQVLRNSMRKELDLLPLDNSPFPRREDGDWPWLPDRPPRESYVQKRPRQRKPWELIEQLHFLPEEADEQADK